MRDFNLRFFRHRWPNKIFELNDIKSLNELTRIEGNYVIGALDGTQFIYPWGTSPVFYIGFSRNLRQRLWAHRKWINRANEEYHKYHFLPLHQYGASFGAKVALYLREGKDSLEEFESKLITDFYEFYGSIPVSNGAWPKTMKKPLGTKIT